MKRRFSENMNETYISILSDLLFFDFGSSADCSVDRRFFGSMGDAVGPPATIAVAAVAAVAGKMPTRKSISFAASLDPTGGKSLQVQYININNNSTSIWSARLGCATKRETKKYDKFAIN